MDSCYVAVSYILSFHSARENGEGRGGNATCQYTEMQKVN
jgi:hypothetical protein